MKSGRLDIARQFATVMTARAGQVRLRLALPVVIAAIFHRFTGWPLAIAWVLAYSAAQALDRLIMPPARIPALMRKPRMRAAALAMVALNGVVFSSYAVLAVAQNTDPWYLAWAALLVSGVVMNAVLTSAGSRAVFVTAMAPQACVFVLLAVITLSHGAPVDHALAMAAAGGLNIFAAVMAWRLFERMLSAEQAARETAENATEAKSAFIAMVSHELRTPISAILAGAAEMEGDPDPRRHSNGALIGESARMMRTLLNDLLDLSKLEVGKMAVESIPYDLAALMRDAAEFWSGAADRKGLPLRLAGEVGEPLPVVGDPTRLRQILNNLLSNAIKFTEIGAVALRFETRTTESGALVLTAQVVDTGPGLTVEQHARLFTAFDQLGAATARTHGGTGLGLNISRQLARLMGGDLEAASRPGHGATFTLTIPLEPAAAVSIADPVAVSQAASAVETGIAGRLKVLVADDHQINRRAFSLMLESAGVEVTTADDGVEALQRLAAERFDVILMDLNMPRMGGLEATERLRRSAGPNRDAPIIALTASVTPGDVALCRGAGMNAFVMKPVDAGELFAAINQVLEGAGETAAEAEAVA
jgi:signal transduction histidine kinase/ActR/RegA family two-component response regulator